MGYKLATKSSIKISKKYDLIISKVSINMKIKSISIKNSYEFNIKYALENLFI